MSLRTWLVILWRRITRRDYFFVGDEEITADDLAPIDNAAMSGFDKLDRGVPIDQVMREFWEDANVRR